MVHLTHGILKIALCLKLNQMNVNGIEFIKIHIRLGILYINSFTQIPAALMMTYQVKELSINFLCLQQNKLTSLAFQQPTILLIMMMV